MSRQHRRKQRFKLKSFYVWHRYMGVSAALFTLLIAATGILLNHTEDFQFDSQHIRSNWVLDWYGIEAPEDLSSFPCGKRHITLMGEHLYLNRKEIDGSYRRLVGAVCQDELLIVAVSQSILLLTRRGELIEQLKGKDGVPAGILAIGSDTDGQVVVRGSHDIYRPDADFIEWNRWEGNPDTVTWVTTNELDAVVKTSLQQHYRTEVLPVERVILDLHSGRFFGKLGPWLFDAAAVLLILLSLTGTWIWIKRRR
jgi:hypothetical protein